MGGVLQNLFMGQFQQISILAPAWGASKLGPTFDNRLQFQFSPPRGGRRAGLKFKEAEGMISILAPAWGASTIAYTITI